MSSKPFITYFGRLLSVTAVIVLVLLTTACGALGRGANSDELSGRLLFWHSWTGEEAVVLNDMLNQFSALHPNVRVIATAFSEETIGNSYIQRTRAGLGPDLTLVDSATAYDLWVAGVLRELLPDAEGSNPARFQNNSYQTVSDAERVIGLPFAGHSQVLFFDRSLVQLPPLTVEQLLDMAGAGLPLAMSTAYPDTHWLMGNYYGRTLNDAGQLELERGGVVNWLEQLQVMASSPGVLIDSRPDVLRQMLADGTAAFYIGDSSDLPFLRRALGEERLGMTTLPIGPFGGPASPVFQTDALVFSPVTDAAEQRIALQLAEFLTNPQMQLQLAVSNVGRIAAGAEPSVGANMPVESLVVSRQIRTGQVVSLALRPNWNVLAQSGGTFEAGYRAALAGVVSPIAFVTTTTDTLVAQKGMEREPLSQSVACPPEPGTVILWHSLEGAETAALSEIGRRFARDCPGNHVLMTYYHENDIYDRFVEAGSDGPEMLLGSSRWLPRLAEQGLIRDIADNLSPETLQTYLPASVVNLTYRNRIFAIPESVANMALVFNRSQVTDPPIDLDGLLNMAAIGQRVALPVGFFNGYWGMAPFGSFEFDSSQGIFSSVNGLTGWLQWLQQNQNRPGMSVTFNAAAAEAEFLAGDAAFLVTGPWALQRLQRGLAAGDLGIVSLPFGPQGAGAPLLQTNGVMIKGQTSDEEVAIAIAFARYLSQVDSQTLFAATGTRVSANVMVDLTDYPLLNGFREQARVSEIAVENATFAEMEALANETYRRVLEDGENPITATTELVSAVHEANE